MKRLRVFAGPNGSGKSTIIKVVKDAGVKLGIYVNADNYKKEINSNHYFNLSENGINWSENQFMSAYRNAAILFEKSEGETLSSLIKFDNFGFSFPNHYSVNDYFTSFLAEYIRYALLDSSEKFTFETVMSHPSKLEFLRMAKKKGYKIYFYFVSLSDPVLNELRVAQRVQLGGHDVPKVKIRERYFRTMDLLLDAIKLSDKAYIFDNSYSSPKLIARYADNELIIDDNIEYIQTWIKQYLIDKLK